MIWERTVKYFCIWLWNGEGGLTEKFLNDNIKPTVSLI